MRPSIDLIKVDADFADGTSAFFLALEDWINSIIVEMDVDDDVKGILWKFQQHYGNQIFQLKFKDYRRFIDERGWDIYSDFAKITDPPGMEERFCQRSIRSTLYIEDDQTSINLNNFPFPVTTISC